MDDIVRDFLVESSEGLDLLDRDLVALEQAPGDPELLARIFRCIHTIKGTCGFLDFTKLESVSHVGESLLSLLRDGVLRLTPDRTSALLLLVDAIREMLVNIEASGTDGDTDYSDLVELLTSLQTDEPASGVGSSTPAEAEAPTETGTPISGPIAGAGTAMAGGGRNMGQLLMERGLVTAEQIEGAIRQQAAGDPRHIGEILVEKGHVPPSAITEALEAQAYERHASTSAADATIRVPFALLSGLTKLVGELADVRNRVVEHACAPTRSALGATAQRLDRITEELHDGIRKLRMQPISAVWSRLPRIARDVAVACNKQVRIEFEGEDIELDRTIIEAIRDPLTHMIRNAIDHGIETPAARIAQGKDPEGRVLMRLFQERDQITIDICDDGAGIDPDALRMKAVQSGMLTAVQSSRMADDEALRLILAPGFTTAHRVTSISGRGVGMDVVRTNVARIGGTVDVASTKDRGTTLRLKIPILLEIIPHGETMADGDRFAVGGGGGSCVSGSGTVRPCDGRTGPRAMDSAASTAPLPFP
jgi:two-component system, chemotaxis family, sensor kinase CheA